MSDLDIKIFCLILKKEAAFEKQLSELILKIKSDVMLNELSNYRSGLSDLKNDFLLPTMAKLPEKSREASSLFTDRYWYFQRT